MPSYQFPEIVSRETETLLETYIEEILKWNKVFCLTSRNIQRNDLISHLNDSLGLANLLNIKGAQALKIADIGSGNGLPGVALNIMNMTNVDLVEISYKKTVFLSELRRTLKLGYNVLNIDVRKLHAKYDILVSKAFADSKDFLNVCEQLITSNTVIYLLKSYDQLSEIEKARESWKFDLNVYDNEFNNSSAIIEIKNISRNDS